jgi:putative transposase
MDFMQDTLVSGRCFPTLNIVDDFSGEALAIEVARSIPGAYIARVLERRVLERGCPEMIVVDNGPEFASRVVDDWAYRNGVRLRDECLSEHWFADIHHARRIIETWRADYNEVRPYSALGNVPPRDFAQQAA